MLFSIYLNKIRNIKMKPHKTTNMNDKSANVNIKKNVYDIVVTKY